ncbi:hypothetical protein CAP35_01590 [Chitinophagaceae bacterium IBVUCB1]|jgi:uncharacterized membrane protein|nr:hypothetical protein CAP35_01590 [Chitinophagaceae bacterium IBVUCB1]
MQNARTYKQVIIGTIILLPLAYIAYMWNDMPATMPLHYNIHGEVDRVGNKNEFLTGVLIITIVNLLTYLLISNIHKIDPKRVKAEQSATFDKLATGVSLFLTAINIIIIADGMSGGKSVADKAIIPLVGLLLAFVGNYMHNLKPNYFAGIRLPWTLSDENNWKQTHRVASHLWVAGGISISIASLTLKPVLAGSILIAVVVCIVAIPVWYSYSLFKKSKQAKS